MKCWILERRLTAYVENAVSESERKYLLRHIEHCAACSAKVASQPMMRGMLRSLPRIPAPPDLRVRLLVLASKASRIDHRPGWAWRRWREGLRLALANLMKPIALPAAGGCFATVLLFMSLVPTFAYRRGSAAEVPTRLWTGPILKNVAPFGFQYGDAEVDVQIDEQGRVVNYSIVSDSSERSDLLRRSIENNLLFTTFTPATSFGVPTSARYRLSFRSSRIDVKG